MSWYRRSIDFEECTFDIGIFQYCSFEHRYRRISNIISFDIEVTMKSFHWFHPCTLLFWLRLKAHLRQALRKCRKKSLRKEGQYADLQHLQDQFLFILPKQRQLHRSLCDLACHIAASALHSCSRCCIDKSMAEVASWEMHRQWCVRWALMTVDLWFHGLSQWENRISNLRNKGKLVNIELGKDALGRRGSMVPWFESVGRSNIDPAK